ncbi:MAG: hypothetical protein J6K00_05215 [Oscillospiraceae bacterium]|nr:hypothetical protein [Oscillospiraceae bacterium]
MHKGPFSLFATIAIVSGIIIILALILPTQFWWFILAAGLICLGIWIRRCK